MSNIKAPEPISEREKWDIAGVRQWCKSAHVDDPDALSAFHEGRGVFDVLLHAPKLERFISEHGLKDLVARSPGGYLPYMSGLANNEPLYFAFKKR
jgi:hypothetical protein